VKEVVSAIAALVSTRCKNRRLVSEALQENRWVTDIAGTLTMDGYNQCVTQWLEIARLHIDQHVANKSIWKGSKTGHYSVRETYRMLCQGTSDLA
jgi:hypothetical protein